MVDLTLAIAKQLSQPLQVEGDPILDRFRFPLVGLAVLFLLLALAFS